MKRTLLAIVAAFVMITSANAQRLTDIQAEARFITDKMIVELGLNSAQRNSLLNINLNYLDGIRSYRDIDAYGWHYRNRQLKRMLNARQWKRFKEPTTSITPSAGTTTLTYTTYTTSIPSTTIVPTTLTRTITASRTSTTRSGSTTRNATRKNTSTTRSATTATTSTTSTTSTASASSTTTHARPIHGERK